MKFDLTTFEAPEGFPLEAINKPEFLKFLDDKSELQLNVYKTDYEEKINKANTGKALTDEKVEALTKKLEEAKNTPNGGGDIEEIKSKLVKAKEDAVAESRGIIEALKLEKVGLTEQLEGAGKTLSETMLKHQLRDAISEYNQKYSAVKIREGSGPSEVLMARAMRDFKQSEDGSFKPYNQDGTPMVSTEGSLSGADYFNHIRSDQNLAFCYNEPTGGGATGGNGGGALPTNNFGGDSSQRKQSIAGKFPELPEK